MVPHTHWDREWYLPEHRFRQRLIALLDDVLDRLAADRTLRFHLDGQVILADDYLDVRPERGALLRRMVAEGRLAVGPWYVLADELLAGDEALVRNLLVGRRRGAALGGWLPVGYSPDAFGHPDALPAILRGFGIDTALLWRGYGGRPGEERDLFDWAAADGSSVLTHHLPPAGYEYGAELPADRRDARARWQVLAAVLEPRALVPVLLVMNGADHHVLQPDLRRAVRALRAAAPGADVTVGSLADYAAAVRAALARVGAPSPRRVSGELRWSYGYTWTLQGVAATRTTLKQAIAEGGALLARWAEPQAALASGPDRWRPVLESAWRSHLANLSHDVLAGCVSDEVAADVRARARQVVGQARGMLTEALDARLGQDPVRRRREREGRTPALVLVNPSPRPRGGVVEATVTVARQPVVVGRPGPSVPPAPLEPFHLVTADGAPVPMQVLEVTDAYERIDSPRDYPESTRVWAVRVALAADAVPAFGLARLDVRAGPPARPGGAARVAATASGVTGPWGTVAVTTGGFVLRTAGGRCPLVPLLVSERDEGDTYTIQPVPGDRPLAAQWGAARAVWPGPVSAAVARTFRLGTRAAGTAWIRADAGSPLVRITVEGVNDAGNHRLRLVLPFGASRTVADMAYGPVVRERVTAPPADGRQEQPATTAPMHRYVRAGEWVVCARGLHEYELLPDGALAVTLLRAVGDLSRGDLPARPGHAGWPTATPGAQQRGPFRAEVAVAFLSEDGDVEALADRFHAPVAGYMCRAGIDLPAEVPGPSLEGADLAFRALKPAEDGGGIVLRCVNLAPEPRQGRWIWPTRLSRAWRARLDETAEAELALSADRRTVAFRAGPREIVTVVVEQ